MTIPRSGDPEIDRALAQLAVQTAQFEEVGRRLESARGRGVAADGQVTVEVLPSGGLASVHIAPRAMRLGSEALCEALMEAARQAEDDVTAQTFTATQALFEEPGR
ncbi:YbaB/EbfC family nucleoid-associated protein [Nonomuraea sp. NPDC052129]|jgi:DNA-binding protein YbaB|uniref:YbaB/EbfC family nucleoid-associated protein n=1 Tax=Nonomuraea TaxID=83681 RepID=UPI001CD999B5|nr:YbaB/EbfC family nucleoid-associated protein [Nonomuraea aurantiaca]MCA2223168.1 YbaB/EbfC family nucleoid-associated protein [Nonomuraea aurantiaca]